MQTNPSPSPTPLLRFPIVIIPTLAASTSVPAAGIRAAIGPVIAGVVGSKVLLGGVSPAFVIIAGAIGGMLGFLAGVLIILLSRIGAIKGSAGSMARAIPPIKRAMLVTYDTHIDLAEITPLATQQARVWRLDRPIITGVEKRPRLQQLARFRLHFQDGSWVGLMTRNPVDIERLQSLLGKF